MTVKILAQSALALIALAASLPSYAGYQFRVGATGIQAPAAQQITAKLVSTPSTLSAPNLPGGSTHKLTLTIANQGENPLEFYGAGTYGKTTPAWLTSPDADADGQLDWDDASSTCKADGILTKGQSCTIVLSLTFWGSTPSGTAYVRQLSVKGMDGKTYDEVALTIPLQFSKQ